MPLNSRIVFWVASPVLVSMPWVISGGIGALLVAAGAGLWWTRRRPVRVDLTSGAKTEVRVTLEKQEVATDQSLNLNQNAPEVTIRVRVEPGASAVSADDLVVRDERRAS